MTAAAKAKRVVVIGAGLGGMSTAIMLAGNAFQVTILEKNPQIGGKLNRLQTSGFSFDLGPSIFTLPQVFRPIFEGDGKQLEDYITLENLYQGCAAVAEGVFAARLVDEEAAHGLGGGGEEMGAVGELGIFSSYEAQPGFMDQRGGL